MSTEKKSGDPVFSKQQILSSANYRERRDLLNVLLEDDKSYSLKNVNQLIDSFMKRKVK
ncbi:hypothetical protein [Heyndrickxia oleronia]|uniref:hypothetical protein n=1 Tax=Heyndrickxia oleronia TaxID=38875 RepID=UPI00333AEDDD